MALVTEQIYKLYTLSRGIMYRLFLQITSHFLAVVGIAVLMLLTSTSIADEFTFYVNNAKGEAIPNAIVYLERADGEFQNTNREGAKPINTSSVNIKQVDKSFSPYLTVANTGSSVTFTNQDDITHHIYSVAGPERFSFSLRAHEEHEISGVDQAGVVAMGCNIHDWMSGYLLLTETPYYAMTDEEGKASIQIDLIASTRVIATAWHPQFNETLRQAVNVPELMSVTLQLKKVMADIPEQKSVDDFDFLDGY